MLICSRYFIRMNKSRLTNHIQVFLIILIKKLDGINRSFKTQFVDIDERIRIESMLNQWVALPS